MRRIIIAACLLGLFAMPAWAAKDQKVDGSTEENGMEQLREGKVRNLKGDDLGTIRNVVVDAITGKAVYVLIMNGEKLYPVPADLIQLEPRTGKIILDVEKEKLLRAPNFTADRMPDLNDAAYGSRIYRYYGVAPFWEKDGSTEKEVPSKPDNPTLPPGHPPVPESREYPII